MAVSAKNRRRIKVAGTSYLWWVTPDPEDDFLGSSMVTVASDDRGLFVRYGLGQPDTSRYVVVLGPSFRGLPGLGGPWRRFRCPRFEDDAGVTPKHVAELIAWCTDAGSATLEVNYLGLEVATQNRSARKPRFTAKAKARVPGVARR